MDLVVMPTTTMLPPTIINVLKEEMRKRKPEHAYDPFNFVSGYAIVVSSLSFSQC